MRFNNEDYLKAFPRDEEKKKDPVDQSEGSVIDKAPEDPEAPEEKEV